MAQNCGQSGHIDGIDHLLGRYHSRQLTFALFRNQSLPFCRHGAVQLTAKIAGSVPLYPA